MKISKDFIREMIKDALLEEDEEDIIRGLDEPEPPDAEEIKQQTVQALERMVSELEGMYDQAQQMGAMLRGISPDLAGDETNITTPVQEMMEKIDNVIEEMQSENTD